MKPQADLILTPGKRMQALCEAPGHFQKGTGQPAGYRPITGQSYSK